MAVGVIATMVVGGRCCNMVVGPLLQHGGWAVVGDDDDDDDDSDRDRDMEEVIYYFNL